MREEFDEIRPYEAGEMKQRLAERQTVSDDTEGLCPLVAQIGA